MSRLVFLVVCLLCGAELALWASVRPAAAQFQSGHIAAPPVVNCSIAEHTNASAERPAHVCNVVHELFTRHSLVVRDAGALSLYTSTMSHASENAFRLGSDTGGWLELVSPLDREELLASGELPECRRHVDRCVLLLTATLTLGSPTAAREQVLTFAIRVAIADVNDEQPQWPPNIAMRDPQSQRDVYILRLPENSPPGHQLLLPTAIDRDEGANGQLRYSLVPDAFPFALVVRPDGLPALNLTRPLDREAVASYSFALQATEKASPRRSTQLPLVHFALDTLALRSVDRIDHNTSIAHFLYLQFRSNPSINT